MKQINILLFLLITLITLIGVPTFGVLVGFTTLDWMLLAMGYCLTGLGITVGYHRLFTHHSFQAHPLVQYVLLILGGWALQNTAIKWASDHSIHHKWTDREADPYNAQRGFWYSHCGWLFTSTQTPEGTRLQVRLRQEVSLAWQERYYLPIVLSGLLIPLGIGFFEGGWLTALGCLLLVGFGRIFLVMNSTFCINSVCHLWGPQPHTLHDSSRDNWWVSLITFGEGYHNYHHAHPSDYRNGPLWFNVDPSKWVIWSLIQLGLSTPRGQQ